MFSKAFHSLPYLSPSHFFSHKLTITQDDLGKVFTKSEIISINMDSVGSNQKETFFFTTTARQNHSVDSFFLTTDEIWGRHHRCSSLINKIKVQCHPKECFRPRNSQLRKGFLIPPYFPFSPVATLSAFTWLGPRREGNWKERNWIPL